jgi:hypothetical protein
MGKQANDIDASDDSRRKRTEMAQAIRHVAMLVQNGQCIGFALVHLDERHDSENTVWLSPGVPAAELIGNVGLLEYGMKKAVRTVAAPVA